MALAVTWPGGFSLSFPRWRAISFARQTTVAP